jgi:zinc protease
VRHETTLDEDMADVKAASLDQVKAFHRDFYGTVPAEMAIVGDFDAEAVVPLVDSCSAPGKRPMAWRRCCASTARSSRYEVLNTPDKENGVYTARMNVDLNVDDPDYPALMLADYIFGGGGLRSRLMDRIRQKEGLSYGGGSNLKAGELDRAGAFSISAIAAPQNLAKGRRRRCARKWRARSRTASRRGTWRRQIGSDAAAGTGACRRRRAGGGLVLLHVPRPHL